MMSHAALEFARIHRLRIPLVAPFQTALATETHRELLLLRVRVGGAEGAARKGRTSATNAAPVRPCVGRSGQNPGPCW
jgi:hypothetical protein